MHYKFIEAEESDRPEPEEVYIRLAHENLAATKFYGLPLTRSPETDKKRDVIRLATSSRTRL